MEAYFHLQLYSLVLSFLHPLFLSSVFSVADASTDSVSLFVCAENVQITSGEKGCSGHCTVKMLKALVF